MPLVHLDQPARAAQWAHAISQLLLCDAGPKVLDVVIGEATWYVPLRDKQPPFTDLRYWSKGAREPAGTARLVREHVTPRKTVKQQLRGADHNRAVDILNSMLVCVVTGDEHARLSNVAHLNGWERYRAAGIRVFDVVVGEWLW